MMRKRPKRKVIPSNNHDFWNEEVQFKNYSRKNFDV